MDGENGLESTDKTDGTVKIDNGTKYLTFTELPIQEGFADTPVLKREFRQPINVRAFVVTLRSPKPSNATEKAEGTTTPTEDRTQPQPVKVTFMVSTKKQGNTKFTKSNRPNYKAAR